MLRSSPRQRTISIVLLVILAISLLAFGGLPGFDLPASRRDPAPVPTPTSWPRTERFASPEYGINIHMWWDPWAAVRRDWGLVQDGGFTWAKQRLAWQDVEGAGPGAYEWRAADLIVEAAEQAGIHLVLRVDHPPDWAVPVAADDAGLDIPVSLEALGTFCTELASRYAGRVRGYQVWNEPNLAREWGGHVPNAAGYAELLKTCYVAIKRADPEALVISAALAPTGSTPPEAVPDVDYLIAFYEAGGAPYFDLLGLNAPGYKAPPEISPAEAADPANGFGGHSFFCFRHAEQMRAIMEEYGDGDKQVAILEFGWHTASSPDHPDYAWFAVTPEEQADYLVRAFAYAREHWAPWVGPMFVWNLPDANWTPDDEEFWWAIVDPFWWGFDGDFGSWAGGGVRPAYEAVRAMEKP
jgi:polysaccharide biosynthesis protein PslG